MKQAVFATLLTLSLATPAVAQQSSDWELHRDSERKLTIASTTFDSGLAVGVRCMNGSFQVLLAGLPAAEGELRPLGIGIGGDEIHESQWSVSTNPETAISGLPAPLARQMRDGGRMQVIVPNGGGEGRNLRHVVDLPSSNSAIDEALTACGRPLVDPRDAELRALGDDGLPKDISWVRQPRPSYPSGSRVYTRGFATLTCITQTNGGLRDCVIETEHPHDGGFGEAALRSVASARLRNNAAANSPMPVTRVMFRTEFRMEDSPSGSSSRIRGR